MRGHQSWIDNYAIRLHERFDVQIYDSKTIGGIQDHTKKQEEVHRYFLDYGINNAVNYLLGHEKKAIQILAFSIGGTIAWKAALKGLKVQSMLAVSATRLRKEREKPDCTIKLIYGDLDAYRPTGTWFSAMQISPVIFPGKDHNLCMNKEVIETSIEEI